MMAPPTTSDGAWTEGGMHRRWRADSLLYSPKGPGPFCSSYQASGLCHHVSSATKGQEDTFMGKSSYLWELAWLQGTLSVFLAQSAMGLQSMTGLLSLGIHVSVFGKS